MDHRALGLLSNERRGDLIIQPPAEIPLTSASEIGPPGVLARLFSDELAKDVDESGRQKPVHPGSLRGEKAAGVFMPLRIIQVDRPMRDVEIAAGDQLPAG